MGDSGCILVRSGVKIPRMLRAILIPLPESNLFARENADLA
jgi:hypothetical protein